jgi:hypothetical protein
MVHSRVSLTTWESYLVCYAQNCFSLTASNDDSVFHSAKPGGDDRQDLAI